MKRLLVVVDFQNDFVCGSLGFEKAKELEKVILEKINEYKNDDIIFTAPIIGEQDVQVEEE